MYNLTMAMFLLSLDQWFPADVAMAINSRQDFGIIGSI